MTDGLGAVDTTGHAITGGWTAPVAELLSLGREARGTNYMFRFFNDDWDSTPTAATAAAV